MLQTLATIERFPTHVLSWMVWFRTDSTHGTQDSALDHIAKVGSQRPEAGLQDIHHPNRLLAESE